MSSSDVERSSLTGNGLRCWGGQRSHVPCQGQMQQMRLIFFTRSGDCRSCGSWSSFGEISEEKWRLKSQSHVYGYDIYSGVGRSVHSFCCIEVAEIWHVGTCTMLITLFLFLDLEPSLEAHPGFWGIRNEITTNQRNQCPPSIIFHHWWVDVNLSCVRAIRRATLGVTSIQQCLGMRCVVFFSDITYSSSIVISGWSLNHLAEVV